MAIRYPISTEKAMRMMEAENKLVFAVDRKDNKESIKVDVEKTFSVKVSKVNTFIDRDGSKRAIVTLAGDSLAIDVVTNLGLM